MTSTSRFEKKTVFHTIILSLALALFANPTWAQDDQSEEDEDQVNTDTVDDTEEPAELGRVQVTGSLIKREDFTSASPMQIINAETQAKVGQLSVADILQSTTVAASTTQLNNQFNGFVVQGGTGVQTLDLRGLGSTRTLVLLNGRRPGGSGTRGEVNAVDLSNIPEIAAQRFEIVLDGSSSIYGSDAVAGVANIITRRSVDGPELQVLTELPFDGGGELYRISGITGWNSSKGSAMISAQYELREQLTLGDRDYLGCIEDLAYDAAGNRIDREDRSITAGTSVSGCGNIYHNTILDHWFGGRLIPSPDGVTIGPMPGYRPRDNGRYDDEGGQAFYEDVLDAPFTRSTSVINRMERVNIYATADYSFDFWGGVDWDLDILYSSRKSESRSWRQFFPVVGSAMAAPYGWGYADDPDWDPSIPLPLGQPVMPYPSNVDVSVDYFYVTTGIQGIFPTDNYWSWQVYASYSYSDGDYTNNSILKSLSGDAQWSSSAPTVDYYDPAILSGENMAALIGAVGVDQTGNTIYDQFQTTAIIAGDLFNMPAGMVGAAFGAEYRTFSINDQPSEYSKSGDLWGQSSAIATKGTNNVMEVFAEAEIPLLAGITAVESLTLNLSGRYFDYKDGGSDTVWKAGLQWNVTPTIMLRSTAGTSYRAPALFELYLGDQSSFTGQLGIDPCIDWGESTNQNIRTNCAADGVPSDYTGFPSTSATVISGGGVGHLDPETSDAFTVGFVWSPEFTDLSIAVDYYEIEVNNQISQLGAGSIMSGCYNSENFPNAFCDLFTRLPADDNFAYNISEVHDTFVNINKQRVEGVDLNVRWQKDYDFGNVTFEAQSTWTLENTSELFDPSLVQGFDETDAVGTIGSPDNVTNLRVSLERNDWNFNYYLQYVSETDDSQFVDEEDSYFGFEPAYFDITMDKVFYHNVSVMYVQDKWDFLVGINNLLDEDPDVVSDVFRGMVGANKSNVPVSASQYDVLGRRLFARFNFRF